MNQQRPERPEDPASGGPPALPAGARPGGRYDAWHPSAPRYVVVDVDGTLLGEEPEATRPVVDALRRAADTGLRVGLATGRMPAAVEPLRKRSGIGGPHVFHNGALACDDEHVVCTWPLSPEQVRRLLEVCREHDLYAELYVGDGYFVTDRREEAAVHWWMLNQPPNGLAEEIDVDAGEVVKATVAVFQGDPDPVLSLLRAAGLAVGAATSPLAPGVTFVNITQPGVDKGRALRRVADYLGIGLDAAVAVGDGHNDLPMLEEVGTAIAMGQALEKVKAVAHLVVPAVEADGVVLALDAAVDWKRRCGQ